MPPRKGWAVELDGVVITGSDDPGDGCLIAPPEGLGNPTIRTEDVTFPQRDGVRHFADWYEPRIITVQASVCGGDTCGATCPGAREHVRNILKAWGRRCDDVELIVWTDCSDTVDCPDGDESPGDVPDRSLVGPYGIVGRPRLATVEWLRGKSKCARLTLRFDARDHRMFILDCEGGPGTVCIRAEPNIEVMGRPYPRCYPMCYSCETSIDSGDAIADVVGDECASPTICFNGQLTNPILENQTTGETVGYFGVIGATDLPVCIDTETGTATQGAASRTHLITGNPQMRLVPGENILRLTSTEATDNGNVEVCFRPFTVSA